MLGPSQKVAVIRPLAQVVMEMVFPLFQRPIWVQQATSPDLRLALLYGDTTAVFGQPQFSAQFKVAPVTQHLSLPIPLTV